MSGMEGQRIPSTRSPSQRRSALCTAPPTQCQTVRDYPFLSLGRGRGTARAGGGRQRRGSKFAPTCRGPEMMLEPEFSRSSSSSSPWWAWPAPLWSSTSSSSDVSAHRLMVVLVFERDGLMLVLRKRFSQSDVKAVALAGHLSLGVVCVAIRS